MANLSLINDLIRTSTEVGTLAFLIFTSLRVGRVASKIDKTHELTTVLVHQTNDLTEKLMEKTDTLAEARGVERGIAQQIAAGSDTSAADLALATAQAAAKVLADAAQLAHDTLAAATATADAKRSP